MFITETSTVEEISQAIEGEFDCYWNLLSNDLDLEAKFLAREIPQAELYQMFFGWMIENDECANA